MCNCDKCKEKKESRIASVRFIGYSFLGIGIATLGKLPAEGTINSFQGFLGLLGVVLLIAGALCLAFPSHRILAYLNNKEVETHGTDKS